MKSYLIKILTVLSALILLLAIPSIWPYAYYQFLRVAIFMAAGLIALRAFDLEKSGWGFVMVVIAILFNPFSPIYLQKTTWVIIDFTTALIFLGSIFVLKEKPAE